MGGTIAYILKFQAVEWSHISNPAVGRIPQYSPRHPRRQLPTITKKVQLQKVQDKQNNDFLEKNPTHKRHSLTDAMSISILVTLSMQFDILMSSPLGPRWIASNCHSLGFRENGGRHVVLWLFLSANMLTPWLLDCPHDSYVHLQ